MQREKTKKNDRRGAAPLDPASQVIIALFFPRPFLVMRSLDLNAEFRKALSPLCCTTNITIPKNAQVFHPRKTLFLDEYHKKNVIAHFFPRPFLVMRSLKRLSDLNAEFRKALSPYA